MALRADAIDLDAGEIEVLAGWDPVEGRQPTKGRERRTVPIIGELRTILAAELLRIGRRGADPALGATPVVPLLREGATAPRRRRVEGRWARAGDPA